MTTEEQKAEILRLIQEALTKDSDEAEGTQVINLDDINLCADDYIDVEDPLLSPDEIAELLHLNDDRRPDERAETGSTDNTGGTDANRTDDDTPSVPSVTLRTPKGGSGDGTEDDALFQNGAQPVSNPPREFKRQEDEKRDKKLGGISGWSGIKIPENANMDSIISGCISEDNPLTNNRAIIEFAQSCIRDEAGVDFKFLVKPGQRLTPDTIIATCTQGGVQKQVRSVFDSGTVLATEDGSDYLRLYKSSGCNRHIIIEDYSVCGEAPEIQQEMLEQVQDKFRSEASINSLITDQLCESILPWILLRRYDSPKYIGIIKIHRPNGREIFGKWLESLKEMKEKYVEDMSKLASEDNIKATGGSSTKVSQLGDKILARRKKYAQDIVWYYTDKKKSLDKCDYDDEYWDCKYLALQKDIENGEVSTHTAIGDDEYNNYYVALLSKQRLGQQDKWSERYFNLLSEIIEERISTEIYSIDQIEREFDDYFHKNVSRSFRDPCKSLRNDMLKIKDELKPSDVSSWITNHMNSRQEDTWTNYSIQQLTSIYMFIHTYRSKARQTSQRRKTNQPNIQQDNKMILELVRKENRKIEAFWEEVLAEFSNWDIHDLIRDVQNIPERLNKFAEWPSPTQIRIDNIRYDHYLFVNPIKSETGTEENYTGPYETTEPQIPTKMDAPEATLADLTGSPNDLRADEIGIIDFKYWQKYFALATVISIPFLNCGLDILPWIQLIPLPCIFICIGVVYIKMFNLLIVFGISIRGMYVWPIILYVNLSDEYLNVLTPLIAQLKSIQSKLMVKIEQMLELPVMSIANGLIGVLETDNRKLRNDNRQLNAYIQQIKTRKVMNQEKIRRNIQMIAHPDASQLQQVIDPLSAEENKN